MTIIDRNTCPIECYEQSSKKGERNFVIQKNMTVSSSNLRPNIYQPTTHDVSTNEVTSHKFSDLIYFVTMTRYCIILDGAIINTTDK